MESQKLPSASGGIQFTTVGNTFRHSGMVERRQQQLIWWRTDGSNSTAMVVAAMLWGNTVARGTW